MKQQDFRLRENNIRTEVDESRALARPIGNNNVDKVIQIFHVPQKLLNWTFKHVKTIFKHIQSKNRPPC